MAGTVVAPRVNGSCRAARRCSVVSRAGAHQPHNSNSRVPFIHARGEPMVAPRSSDMGADPFGLLLSQRTIVLGGEVNDFSADAVISQLLLLDSQNPKEDIKLFINSPGGSVTAGMGLYDAMLLCRADVQTYCFGLAASMGAFLLGAGCKGKRYAMPNARIMIHQPLGGASGQAIDVEIQAREMMYHKTNLNRIMSGYTGQTVDQIELDTDRDRYMSPIEAKQYGLIDHVIGGDDAGYSIEGSTKAFTKRREMKMSTDPDRTRGSRFRKATEPYMEPLYKEERQEKTEAEKELEERKAKEKEKEKGN